MLRKAPHASTSLARLGTLALLATVLALLIPTAQAAADDTTAGTLGGLTATATQPVATPSGQSATTDTSGPQNLAGTLAPVTQAVTQTAAPIVQGAAAAVAPVSRAAAPVTQVVTQAAKPAAEIVTQAAEPVTRTITQTAAAATETINTTLTPVNRTVAQALAPVSAAVAPTAAAITRAAETTLAGAGDSVSNAVAPVTQGVDRDAGLTGRGSSPDAQGPAGSALATLGDTAPPAVQPVLLPSGARPHPTPVSIAAMPGSRSSAAGPCVTGCAALGTGALRSLDGSSLGPLSIALAAVNGPSFAVPSGEVTGGSPPERTPPSPLPSPTPGGTTGSIAAGAGIALTLFITLAGLLPLRGPRAKRRLRLASELRLTAPFVLIPERPG